MFDPTDLPSRDTELPRNRFERPDETPEPEVVPQTGCDNCKGSGWDERLDNHCSNCNGTGTYMTSEEKRALWAAYDAKRKESR